MKMYTNIRRKAKDEIELQPITVTLPTAVLVELANNGVESGRGGGNLSNFIEIAALVTVGIFADIDTARDNLLRLIRVDINAHNTTLELASRIDALAQQIRDSVMS